MRVRWPALVPLLLLALPLLAAPAWALGPLEKNHPDVAEGTRLYEQGSFEQALQSFDAAALERPLDPRVQYDRGLSLYKLGRHDEARAALEKAAELDREGQLTAKTHYNLGNVAAAAGDAKRAIQEFRTALRADPADEQARHNLEVLLKKLPPRKDTGPDGGAPDGGPADAGQRDAGASDAGRPDGGHDGGTDGGRPDGGAGDGGQGDAGADGGPGDGQGKADAGRQGQPQPGDGGADGGADLSDAGLQSEPIRAGADGGVEVSRREAEKLLDSLKNSEKNLQLWRFRQKTQKSTTHAKDW
jgi:tetratricopeptide (TPR) repeat protein